jgi:hypothetical protein
VRERAEGKEGRREGGKEGRKKGLGEKGESRIRREREKEKKGK